MRLKLQISFDFVLTILVFITLVTYFLFYLITQRNVSITGLKREDKFLKALSISQMLVGDYGEPKDWWRYWTNPSVIKRIGFLNESYSYPNYISRIKAYAFTTTFCNSETKYESLKKLLGLDKYNVMVITKFSDGTTYLCPTFSITLGSPENITRKAFDSQNNQTATIFIAVGD